MNKYNDKNACVVLVGNKCDLEDKREVSYAEAKEFADSMGFNFIETSAKTSNNIEETFNLMAKEMKEKNQIGRSRQNLKEGSRRLGQGVPLQ